MALGLQRAGFRHSLLVDSSKDACDTLTRNGFQNVLCGRVEDVDFRAYSGISLLAGGPPCTPFSVAGKDGGEGDDRNGWEECIRVVRQTKCEAFLFENVDGLARDKFRESWPASPNWGTL